MQTTPCSPCCSTALTTNIPGAQGDAGADGAAGTNAYSVTQANFVIPAVGANVTVTVDQSDWFAVGQVVVADGPAHFTVASVPDGTSVVLTNLGYTGDLAVGATITSGAKISPAGVQGVLDTPLSVYGAGTAYEVTATSALIDFGAGTPLSLTLTAPGTYVLFAAVRYDFNGATFAAVRNLTTKLRRTNNTAADVADSSLTVALPIVTTITYTAAEVTLPPVTYTTANSDDVIQVWGSVNVVPTAGSLDAVDGYLYALKIA